MPNSDEQSQQNIPTTKQQLIVMLKQQLEKVQDEISDMQHTLDNQRQVRKELTSQLQQKQQKIQQLLQNQTKTLGDKVHEGIYSTIQAANKIRADAQAQKLSLSEENSALNQKITHKDSKIMENRQLVRLNTKKVSALEQKKTDLIRKEQNLVDKKQQIKKKFQMMKRQHERVERQQLELRTHIENLKKLRLYLNKNLESGLKNLNPPLPNKGSRAKQPIADDNDNFWN